MTSMFQDPNNGLPLAKQQLQPSVVNQMNNNIRFLWQLALRSTTVATAADSTWPIRNLVESDRPHWIDAMNCWAYQVDTGGAPGYIFLYSSRGQKLIGSGITVALLPGNDMFIGCYPSPTTVRIEAYSAADTVDVVSTVNYGQSYSVINAAVAGRTRDAYAGVLWLGGPQNTRITVGYQTGEMRIIAITDDNTEILVALPSAALITPDRSSFDTDGLGNVVMVTKSSTRFWFGNGYGLTTPSWQSGNLPSGANTNSRRHVSHDSVSGKWVILQETVVALGVNAGDPTVLKMTTSSDGVTWQNWQELPIPSRIGTDLTKLVCASGVWFVVCPVSPTPGSVTQDQLHIELFASYDQGASWMACGKLAEMFLGVYRPTIGLARASDGRLVFTSVLKNLSYVLEMGPFVGNPI